MDIQKPNFREISTEDFINFVFILVTLFILSSVFWSDERDISGYYQNLIIASFSIASVILHICHEIKDNKNNGFIPPGFISFSYALSKFLVAVCCAVPICFYSMADKNTFLGEHVHCNLYWGICLITFIPIVFVVIWGYIYPLVADIPYKNKKIRYEERPN